jgi:hypothetical protein
LGLKVSFWLAVPASMTGHVDELADALRKMIPWAKETLIDREERLAQDDDPINRAMAERCSLEIEEAEAILVKVEDIPTANVPLITGNAAGTLLEHMEHLASKLNCVISFRQGMFHFIPNGEQPSDEMLALSVKLAQENVAESRYKS